MKILITTSPLYGHFFPMLPLIGAMRRAGHTVAVATGPDLADEIHQRGLACWNVGPRMADVLVGIHSRPEEPMDDPMAALREAALDYFGEPGVARATDLLTMIAADPPDLIVHEHSDLAGWLIAARLDQPAIVHGFGPHLPFTREIAALLFEFGNDRIGGTHDMTPLSEVTYLDPWPAALRSTETCPYGRVLPIRPEQEPAPTGAELPDAVSRLPHRTTLYATLGTVFTEANTLRAVVDAVADQEVNLVLTTGQAVDPVTLGTLPRNVAAHSFIPQELVMPHCTAVISHAGSGTVLGALSARLPQVCLPAGADQFINADRLAHLGAGICLQPDQKSPDQIWTALQSVLDDRSFTDAASALQDDIEAMPPAETVLADVLPHPVSRAEFPRSDPAPLGRQKANGRP